MDEASGHEDRIVHSSAQDANLALSRRSFVMTVGALVALPTVAGGFAMPIWTEKAYAAGDESGSSSDSSNGSAETKVIVAKKNEFGIVVCDMTENKKTPVANAAVKLVSYSSNKEISGKTDAEGKVLLDISSLATLKKDELGVETYSFFAKMDVSCEGYRTYRTGRIWVIGGRGIMAPTRKMRDEGIYPRMVTFDDWDVLYTANSFAVTLGNDIKHKLKVELEAKEAMNGRPVTVKIVAAGQSKAIVETDVKPSNGIAKAEFSGYFLLKNHESALPVGPKFELSLEFDGTRYVVPLSLRTQAAPDSATAPGSSKVTLSPFNPHGLKPSITMPDWIPILGGKSVDVWTPTLPISFWFDPYGFVKFVARTGELGYKYKEEDGQVKLDAWKQHPRKSAEEQWNEVNSERKNLMKKYGKAVKGKGGLFQSLAYTSTISATAMLQIALAGKWKSSEALWRGGLSMQAVLAFNVSYSQQFMVGPFPFIFDFGITSSLTVGASIAWATPAFLEIDNYTWDYGSTGISITIVIAPSISLGIGIKGLLSASVQGQLSFSFCVALNHKPPEGKHLSNPHLTMGLVAQVNIVVQAFIFSKSFELWKAGDPAFYDNWNGGFSGNAARAMSTQADDIDYFGDGMQLVKDEWLLDVSEFESAGFSEASLAAQSNAPRFEAVEKKVSTIDGIAYHCTTFEPATTREMAAASAGDGTGQLAVGTASNLIAQDAPEELPEEAKYKVNDPEKYEAFVEERSQNRFKGIASRSGLVPANDVRVAEGVFSDPRISTARIAGKTYLFRISTTKVNGQSRTRIVGQVLGNNGKPSSDMKVFDFNYANNVFNYASLPNRNDLYDYDFDVRYTQNSNPGFTSADLLSLLTGRGKIAGTLTFFVVSGKRAAGDKTGFGQAACDQVFSIVTFYVFENGDTVQIDGCASVTNDPSFDAAGGGDQYKYHSFSCPQISDVKATADGAVTGWMLTYLDRAGKTPDDAVSAEKGKAKVGLGVCFMDNTGKISAIKTHELVEKVQPITDSSVYEMTCSSRLADGGDGVSGWYLVMLRGRNEALYYLLRAASGMKVLFFDKPPILEVKAIKAKGSETSEPMRLVEWPGHVGTFLTSKAGKLQKVTIENLGKGEPSLKYADCGLSKFNVNSFGVDPSGNIIYWPSCSEDNAGYEYDKQGNGKKRKWEEVHQVMGSRLRNGTFSDPFVYGEVKHDMHVMQVIDYLDANSLTILSVDMKDALKGKADLWFTSIPLVRCANVIGCESAAQFTYPGEKALFYLTVRNDGNTFLSGFTAKLSERGKSPVSSAKLVFSKSSLCESGFNPADGGSLKDVEPDYALAPGKTSVYEVEITIPKDWKDQKRVSISAADAVMASSTAKTQGALSGQADLEELAQSVEEYIIGTGDQGSRDYYEEFDDDSGRAPFDVLDVWYADSYDNEDEEEYEDSPLVEVEEDASEKEDDKKGAASHTSKTSQRSVTPATGDLANPLGLAAAAVLAASAGMVAYSKRRTELEEQADKPEE